VSVQTRLDRARARLESLTAQRDAIQARADNRHWTELDSATWSGVRRKPNPKADERRFARYAREAQVFADYETAQRDVEILEARAEAEAAEAVRVRFTAADLAGVTHVRDRFGWHRVVRVNAKSVTVETGYSWTDRIALDGILEHRTVTS